MPARERPCLEHMQQLDRRVGQHLAHVLSLVFYWWQFKPPGAGVCLERKPYLSNLLPQGTVCSIHAKHGV